MLCKALLTVDSISGAADGPPEQQALRCLRVGDTKRNRDGAPHAAPHHVRPRDAQVLEETEPRANVMGPGHDLDASAGFPSFATVEDDALKAPLEMMKQPDSGVRRDRRPFVQRGIEAAGREHQQRRAVTAYLVSRRNAVDDCRCHYSPRSGRAARTSSQSAPIALSALAAI